MIGAMHFSGRWRSSGVRLGGALLLDTGRYARLVVEAFLPWCRCRHSLALCVGISRLHDARETCWSEAALSGWCEPTFFGRNCLWRRSGSKQ